VRLTSSLLAVLSFYFFIDFVSAASLVPEVLLLFGYDIFAAGNASVQKSGLAARAGFRTGRLVRLLRILKLLRIFKILAIFGRTRKRGSEQTALGIAVHESLQQKMVILVVALILCEGSVLRPFMHARGVAIPNMPVLMQVVSCTASSTRHAL
jgi:hypothetical protein